MPLLSPILTSRSLNNSGITEGPELEMLAAWLATNPSLTHLKSYLLIYCLYNLYIYIYVCFLFLCVCVWGGGVVSR